MLKKRRVAIVIDLEWPYKYHQEMFAGIQKFAKQTESWDSQIDMRADETLSKSTRRQPAYDGVVGRVSSRLLKQTKRLGIPAVNVWLNSPVMRDMPSVIQDHRYAGSLAAEHLHTRGLRSFGYLGYRRDLSSREQWNGFQETVNSHGLDAFCLLVALNSNATSATWLKFQESLDEWISSWKPPIGIFVIHDLTCRYLAEAIRQQSLNMPNDVALIAGYNEPLIATSGDPTLTGIEWGFERVGFGAAELLDRLLIGEAPPTEPVLKQPVEIVVRRSTDVILVDDSLVAQSLRYISEHSHQQIQVDDVAKAVATTRRSLERRFRSALDRTIADEIARLRIERVKRLLIQTDLPIKSLAAQSGFGDSIQLCKVFRRLVGITPGQFRKQRK